MNTCLQGQLGLLGIILMLTACSPPPEQPDTSANHTESGEEEIAIATQEPDTATTTPAPRNAVPASTVAIQPAATDASRDGQIPANPQRDRAIFKAAGLSFVQARGQWESGNCGDPPMGTYEPGAINKIEDINGDGRPEAIVIEEGTCYGNIGVRFWLLSQQPGGRWTVMTDSIAIPEFLTTKGVDNFPDIQGGGPGFCFPVARWNGREYLLHRHEYEGKPCSPAP